MTGTTSTSAVLVGPRQLEFRELPLPPLRDDDGLLEVEGTGVCGSDWGPYAGLRSGVGPHILGHEVVGRIAAIGALAASRWKLREGDRVVVEEAIPCRHCELCLSGRHYMCDQLHGTAGLRYGSTPVTVTPSLWGGLGQFLYLHPNAVLHPIAETVPVDQAPLFIPLSNGIRWVQKVGGCRIGDTVVVQGPGQHGLGCVVAAKMAGARCVIVIGTDRDERRLNVALELGADHVLAGVDGSANHVAELTGGRMADLVVDVTAGAPNALVDALAMVRIGGTVVAAGGRHGQPCIGFPSDDLLIKEVTVRGVYGRDAESVTRALNLIESATLPLGRMCTDTFPLDQADAALRALGGEGEANPIHITVLSPTTKELPPS